MASTDGAPERIALDTEQQAMTHAQLRAHAEAAHGSLASSGPSTGMRAEHAEILNAALGRTKTLLAGLAGINQNGVSACHDFGSTEDHNEQAVSDLNQDVPRLI
jgi:hypothetical protein